MNEAPMIAPYWKSLLQKIKDLPDADPRKMAAEKLYEMLFGAYTDKGPEFNTRVTMWIYKEILEPLL